MKVITFILETQQPVLATSFQGDPNSDVSFPYIPGSMIRGALIGRYLKRHPELPDDILSDAKINQEVKRLFFDGNTRYLNAYLFCEQQKRRTLPVPLSWYRNKDEDLPQNQEPALEVYDLSQSEPEQVSLKGLSEKFCTVNERQVVLYREKRRINIHTARDRTKGRSSPTKHDPATNKVIQEGEGAIFCYEALDVNQTFQGVILCEDDDAQTIKDLLKPADIWLGGSISAGYGHTKIISEVKLEDIENWTEIGIESKKRVDRNHLKITLLSDTIIRDRNGQVSSDYLLVKQAIEEKLQFKSELPKPTNVFLNSTIVGGFNRKWGLPLPQDVALSAGSVFVFNNIKLTSEQIKILEREGIGDRCLEGFGRLAFNWLGEYREFSATPPELFRANETQLDEKYHDLAAQMAENILRQRLDQSLVKEVSDINLQGNITNSQLSRLEIVVRQGLTNPPSFLPLIELLSSLTSNAREQYRNTKVSGNKSLEQQLKDWLVKPIGNTDSWLKNPQDLEVNIAGISTKIKPDSDLATEYTLRLIMAVAKKAKKEKNK